MSESVSVKAPIYPRELRVTAMLADGKTAKLIAYELGLSVHTIQKYMKDALKKSGASTSTGLVAMALRNGWIE